METAGTLGEYLRAAQGHDLYQAVVNYSSLSAYGAIEDGTVIPEGGGGFPASPVASSTTCR